MKKIKIWLYKRLLKSAYLKYISNDYGCGDFLTNYISLDKERVNYCIRKLQSLGETIKELK
jgi:hypothetical protein